MDLVPYAIPFFLVAVVAEILYDRWRGTGYYRTNDAINSMSMGVISTTSKLVVISIAGIVYAYVQNNMALTIWSTDSWLNWVAALLVYDICYYWFHRMSHERKLFWAAHVVHHQSEEYNLTTALRQTSTGFIITWIFYLPSFFLGVPAEIFVTVASIHLIYQFWIHTRFIPELGWFEWIFASPSNHRVHHGRNEVYMDRNYGGLLIVWDRLFGTYQRELAETPVEYGITRGLNSWNPLWGNIHVYLGMFQDSRRTPLLSDKFRVWFGATRFVAPGTEKDPAAAGNLYNPDTAGGLRLYVLAQFILAVLVGLLVLFNQAGDSDTTVLLLFGFMLWSLLNVGWLLEGRFEASEWLRLVCSFALLMLVPASTASWIVIATVVSLLTFGLIKQQGLILKPLANSPYTEQ